MSDPRVSALVVTYRRPEDLHCCLDTLLAQTMPPVEVIVVDNGAAFGDVSEPVCQAVADRMSVRYIANEVNSLPAARNLGVRHCTGDFIALIDDDVQLAPDYLEAVYRVFLECPGAVGVQGYIEPAPRPWWREQLQWFFGLYHLEPNCCRVLPAVSTTYPAPLKCTITCEWISGSNQVYRRHVLDEVQWDERLLKYADGEDLDHSFRVYQRYPGRLFITPHARVFHKESQTGRTASKELIAMREVYGYYLSHKLLSASPRKQVAYLWSRAGRLILLAAVAMTRRRAGAGAEFRALLDAYRLVWKHRRAIRVGKLDAFHSSLSGERNRVR